MLKGKSFVMVQLGSSVHLASGAVIKRNGGCSNQHQDVRRQLCTLSINMAVHLRLFARLRTNDMIQVAVLKVIKQV